MYLCNSTQYYKKTGLNPILDSIDFDKLSRVKINFVLIKKLILFKFFEDELLQFKLNYFISTI